MLTVDEALDAVRSRCTALPAQRRGLAAALGCVLAEDVIADLDLPPFDKALVDGYAVRSADLDGTDGDRRLRIEVPHRGVRIGVDHGEVEGDVGDAAWREETDHSRLSGELDGFVRAYLLSSAAAQG